MAMTRSLRKFVFTSHVTSSVGWLGAVVAYLAVAGIGLTSRDEQLVRSAYLMTEVIIRFVIMPISFAALLTGLVQSLGTEWGLFRHYWVATKFLLSVVATVILLVHMQTVSHMASLAGGTSWSTSEVGMLRAQMVVHAAGGLIVLLTATVLSIYKPWGKTSSGRKREGEVEAPMRATTLGMYLVIALLALFVVLHLAGGMRIH
jgi:hypothetical protein